MYCLYISFSSINFVVDLGELSLLNSFSFSLESVILFLISYISSSPFCGTENSATFFSNSSIISF